MRTNSSICNSRLRALIVLAGCASLCGAPGAAAQIRISERPGSSGNDWFPLCFSIDSRLLAIPASGPAGEASDQDIELWNLREGRTAAMLAHPDGRMKPESLSGVYFLGDGCTLAAVFRRPDSRRKEDHEIAFFDVPEGKHRASVRLGKWGGFHGLAFSPDGARFAMAIGSGPSDERFEVAVWDVAKASQIKRLDEAPTCTDIAYSPDGRWLATVHGFSDAKGQVIVWDAETLERRHTLRAGGGWLFVAFSPDSKLLAAGVNVHAKRAKIQPGVRLWDVATGKELGWIDGLDAAPRPITNAVPLFVPDSRFLVASCISAPPQHQRQIRLWDTASGAQSLLDEEPRAGNLVLLRGIAISPDGKLMAEGTLETKPAVKLWDAKYWKPLWTLDISSQNKTTRPLPSTPLAFFSPDGKWLAAALTINGWHTWEGFLWEASEFATKPAGSTLSPGNFLPIR